MRSFAPFALAAVAAIPLAMRVAAAQTPSSAAPAAASARSPEDCAPVGDVGFICGGPMAAPAEDMVPVPGDHWVIAGSRNGAGGGGLRLIDTHTKSITTLYPVSANQDKLDKTTYASCPGPLSGEEREKMVTHGLHLEAGRNGVHKVFAVHHAGPPIRGGAAAPLPAPTGRESVEVFTVDTRGKTPTATWIGCVVAPDTVGLNAVVSLPDGGLIATNYNPRGAGAQEARARMSKGENNGEMWEWHPGKGWAQVPNSEMSGANGVLLSQDGRTLYVAAWGSNKFVRLSRDGKQRDEVPVGFKIDNIRWSPDGQILGGGQGDRTTWVVKIDPKSLQVTPLIKDYANSQAFSTGTVAIQIGKELWVGSTSFPHIAVFTVR